jgi:hypothetical protein
LLLLLWRAFLLRIVQLRFRSGAAALLVVCVRKDQWHHVVCKPVVSVAVLLLTRRKKEQNEDKTTHLRATRGRRIRHGRTLFLLVLSLRLLLRRLNGMEDGRLLMILMQVLGEQVYCEWVQDLFWHWAFHSPPIWYIQNKEGD